MEGGRKTGQEAGRDGERGRVREVGRRMGGINEKLSLSGWCNSPLRFIFSKPTVVVEALRYQMHTVSTDKGST